MSRNDATEAVRRDILKLLVHERKSGFNHGAEIDMSMNNSSSVLEEATEKLYTGAPAPAAVERPTVQDSAVLLAVRQHFLRKLRAYATQEQPLSPSDLPYIETLKSDVQRLNAELQRRQEASAAHGAVGQGAVTPGGRKRHYSQPHTSTDRSPEHGRSRLMSVPASSRRVRFVSSGVSDSDSSLDTSGHSTATDGSVSSTASATVDADAQVTARGRTSTTAKVDVMDHLVASYRAASADFDRRVRTMEAVFGRSQSNGSTGSRGKHGHGHSTPVKGEAVTRELFTSSVPFGSPTSSGGAAMTMGELGSPVHKATAATAGAAAPIGGAAGFSYYGPSGLSLGHSSSWTQGLPVASPAVRLSSSWAASSSSTSGSVMGRAMGASKGIDALLDKVAKGPLAGSRGPLSSSSGAPGGGPLEVAGPVAAVTSAGPLGTPTVANNQLSPAAPAPVATGLGSSGVAPGRIRDLLASIGCADVLDLSLGLEDGGKELAKAQHRAHEHSQAAVHASSIGGGAITNDGRGPRAEHAEAAVQCALEASTDQGSPHHVPSAAQAHDGAAGNTGSKPEFDQGNYNNDASSNSKPEFDLGDDELEYEDELTGTMLEQQHELSISLEQQVAGQEDEASVTHQVAEAAVASPEGHMSLVDVSCGPSHADLAASPVQALSASNHSLSDQSLTAVSVCYLSVSHTMVEEDVEDVHASAAHNAAAGAGTGGGVDVGAAVLPQDDALHTSGSTVGTMELFEAAQAAVEAGLGSPRPAGRQQQAEVPRGAADGEHYSFNDGQHGGHSDDSSISWALSDDTALSAAMQHHGMGVPHSPVLPADTSITSAVQSMALEAMAVEAMAADSLDMGTADGKPGDEQGDQGGAVSPHRHGRSREGIEVGQDVVAQRVGSPAPGPVEVHAGAYSPAAAAVEAPVASNAVPLPVPAVSSSSSPRQTSPPTDKPDLAEVGQGAAAAAAAGSHSPTGGELRQSSPNGQDASSPSPSSAGIVPASPSGSRQTSAHVPSSPSPNKLSESALSVLSPVQPVNATRQGLHGAVYPGGFISSSEFTLNGSGIIGGGADGHDGVHGHGHDGTLEAILFMVDGDEDDEEQPVQHAGPVDAVVGSAATPITAGAARQSSAPRTADPVGMPASTEGRPPRHSQYWNGAASSGSVGAASTPSTSPGHAEAVASSPAAAAASSTGSALAGWHVSPDTEGRPSRQASSGHSSNTSDVSLDAGGRALVAALLESPYLQAEAPAGRGARQAVPSDLALGDGLYGPASADVSSANTTSSSVTTTTTTTTAVSDLQSGLATFTAASSTMAGVGRVAGAAAGDPRLPTGKGRVRVSKPKHRVARRLFEEDSELEQNSGQSSPVVLVASGGAVQPTATVPELRPVRPPSPVLARASGRLSRSPSPARIMALHEAHEDERRYAMPVQQTEGHFSSSVERQLWSPASGPRPRALFRSPSTSTGVNGSINGHLRQESPSSRGSTPSKRNLQASLYGVAGPADVPADQYLDGGELHGFSTFEMAEPEAMAQTSGADIVASTSPRTHGPGHSHSHSQVHGLGKVHGQGHGHGHNYGVSPRSGTGQSILAEPLPSIHQAVGGPSAVQGLPGDSKRAAVATTAAHAPGQHAVATPLTAALVHASALLPSKIPVPASSPAAAAALSKSKHASQGIDQDGAGVGDGVTDPQAAGAVHVPAGISPRRQRRSLLPLLGLPSPTAVSTTSALPAIGVPHVGAGGPVRATKAVLTGGSALVSPPFVPHRQGQDGIMHGMETPASDPRPGHHQAGTAQPHSGSRHPVAALRMALSPVASPASGAGVTAESPSNVGGAYQQYARLAGKQTAGRSPLPGHVVHMSSTRQEVSVPVVARTPTSTGRRRGTMRTQETAHGSPTASKLAGSATSPGVTSPLPPRPLLSPERAAAHAAAVRDEERIRAKVEARANKQRRKMARAGGAGGKGTGALDGDAPGVMEELGSPADPTAYASPATRATSKGAVIAAVATGPSASGNGDYSPEAYQSNARLSVGLQVTSYA